MDAVSGRLLEVRDLLAYATGQAKVFDPNPIVSSGDLGLSSATSSTKLNAERVSVTLLRLDPPLADGRLRLDGAWVRIHDFGDPTPAEPANSTGHFVFSSNSPSFLAAMVYFHIDRFQQYVQTDLGLSGVGNLSVPVDPQLGTSDGSHGTGAGLGLGDDAVPDASDAMVILHEYGHFLQDRVNPGSSVGNFPSGVGEGFGDFLAAVYYDDKHTNPAETRGLMFSWNANPTESSAGRSYKLAAASETAWDAGGGYERGALWCSTMFELYRKLGGDSARPDRKAAGRDLAIRLHILANVHVLGESATVTEMAHEIETADGRWAAGGTRTACTARSSATPSVCATSASTPPRRWTSTSMTAGTAATGPRAETTCSRRCSGRSATMTRPTSGCGTWRLPARRRTTRRGPASMPRPSSSRASGTAARPPPGRSR